ncbi:MAG: protein kinase [Lentisphaeraceae bacterium]|nr:protein kinase [Lentisphaeraceae bacterium]
MNNETITDGSKPLLPWETFPEVGDSFANYKLKKIIGKGSFGTVFQVQPDESVEWFEAVKVLHRSSRIDKSRFTEEINKLKEIRLPGIARIHTTGEENGFLYYSMDYIDGECIDTWSARPEISYADIFSSFLELCLTVENLHEQSFLHLDIKPQNIMINSDKQVRLLDFGISTKLGTASDLSADGLGAGTYEYAAPEQILGDTPTPQMDVYALACLLYTLLSGHHPKLSGQLINGSFEADHRLSREAVIEKCTSHITTDICDSNFEMTQEISSVLKNALAPKDSRFTSVKDFRLALIRSGCLNPFFYVVFDGSLEKSTPFLPTLETLKLEFANQIQLSAYTKTQKETGDFEVSENDDCSDVQIKLRQQIFNYLAKPDADAWQTSPYRSLKSYGESDSHLFFGRDKEIASLCSLIENSKKDDSLITVLAPSGAGKSSFLKAGVIPLFKQSAAWECFVFSPNNKILRQLKDILESTTASTQKTLIIIDQFEEHLQTPQESDEFVSLLQNLLATNSVKIILSLRNDFYKECIQFLDSFQLSQNFYNLPAANESSIARMIRMPAIKAHLKFGKDPVSGKSLADILKEEAMQTPESLAALSFTLDEIFDKSPHGLLSFEVYQKLGGMNGAMAKRAESVIASLSLINEKDTFHIVFQKLIQVDEKQTPRRLYTEYSAFKANSDCLKLTDAFIEAKLFTVSTDNSTNERIVTVAHEALIQQFNGNGWPRVIHWLSQQKNNLLIRKRLSIALNDWLQNNRDKKFLISSKDQLHEIISLKKLNWSFSDIEETFLSKSSNQIRSRSLFAYSSLAAIGIISFYLWKETNTVDNLTKEKESIKIEVNKLSLEALKQESRLKELQKQEKMIHEQLVAMNDYSKLSRIASLQQNNSLPTPTAISLLSEINEENRNWMWGQTLYKSIPDHLVLFGHKEEILSVDFSKDTKSKYLLTSSWDDSAILWDSESGNKLVTFNYSGNNPSSSDLEDAKFSYDGFAALACNDGFVYLWNVDESIKGEGTAQSIKMPHTKIRRLFFSSDNKYLLCAGSEGSFSIWDWQNKLFDKPLAIGEHSTDNNKRLYSAQVSPDGKFIVSAGWDGKIKRWQWDGKTLNSPKVVGAHDSEIWDGRFSPDGKYYLSAGRDKKAILWDVEKFTKVKVFGTGIDGHTSDVRSATFSPGMKTILTGSRNKTLRKWNIETGKLISSTKVHDNIIYDISFNHDGSKYATVSADKVLNVYETDKPKTKTSNILYHSDSVEDFDILDGQLVTASSDGEVRFWDLQKKSMLMHFSNNSDDSKQKLSRVQFLNDETLITANTSGVLRIWEYVGHAWELVKVINSDSSERMISFEISANKQSALCSFRNGDIYIFEISSGNKIYSFNNKDLKDESPVITVIDSDNILCGLENGMLYSLNTKTKKLSKLPISHSRKVFHLNRLSINGESFFTSTSRDGYIYFFDASFNKIKEFTHGVRGDASHAAISPSNDILVSASTRDSNIFVWDLKNNVELLPLSGHDGSITKVKVIDNSLIVSSSQDGTVRLWNSLDWQVMKQSGQEESLLNNQQALIEAIKEYQLKK